MLALKPGGGLTGGAIVGNDSTDEAIAGDEGTGEEVAVCLETTSN